MERIRIGLIDDQKLFRQSLGALITGIEGLELVMEADNGVDCLIKLKDQLAHPHIVLMDMEMPEMDGMELNTRLHEQYPEIKVIVLSVHARERLIARMIEAGASGYLFKNCDKEELVTAIKTVMSSGYYINAQVLKAIQQNAGQKDRTMRVGSKIPVELSGREKEILTLICREYSNAEIAEKLFISVRTAEGHRNNLLVKTGCRNTAGLVLFAIKYHLVELVF